MARLNSRLFDPLEFAHGRQVLQDETPVAQFKRLCEGLAGSQDGLVTWRLAGRTDGQDNAWLDVQARGRVRVICQRCLEAMDLSLDVANSLRLLRTQAQLEAMDALEADGLGEDTEYLVAEPRMDGLGLVEDELILAVPFAPMHDTCSGTGAATDDGPDTGRPSPFAALARLKKH